MNTSELDTAAEMWELLGQVGGLQATDYDQDLVQQIASALGLAGDRDLGAQLREANTSIEAFTKAFFEAAGVYVVMWSELLAFFEAAAATATDTSLRVSYCFDQAEVVNASFHLDHFREWVRTAQRLTARFWFSSETGRRLWDISEVFRLSNAGFIHQRTTPLELVDFVTACREGPWPDRIPAHPRVVRHGARSWTQNTEGGHKDKDSHTTDHCVAPSQVCTC